MADDLPTVTLPPSETVVQDLVLARQVAENEFVQSFKEKSQLSELNEDFLRKGFQAGFYEAYAKLKELNKMQKLAKAREKKANKKHVSEA